MKKVVSILIIVLSISISGKLLFLTEVLSHLLSGGSLSIGLLLGLGFKLLIIGVILSIKVKLLMWVFKITRIDIYLEKLAISLRTYWENRNKKETLLLTNGK